MKRLSALAAGMALLLVTAGPAFSQTEGEEAPSAPAALVIESLDTSAHPTITMTVSVPRDLLGRDLLEGGFQVTEGGVVRPTTVEQLSTDNLEVVLLLDASGSMAGEPLAAAKDAAGTFVGQMPAGVRIAVVAFGNEPTVVSEFSTNPDEALSAIAGLRSGGETALYDGLRTSASLFSEGEDVRRTVVVLSDGGDTVSNAGIEQVLIDLLDASVGFYAVELKTAESDSEPLERLGIATGGTVASVDDPAGITGIFDEIAALLVNRYRIEFTSESFGQTDLVVTAQASDVSATAESTMRLPEPPPPVVVTVATTLAPGAVATTIPPLRVGSAVTISWLDSTQAFYVAILAIFLALAGLLLLTRNRPIMVRLSDDGSRVPLAPRGKAGLLAGLAATATDMADLSLSRAGRRGRLNSALERAGIAMRPAEFVVMTVSAALGVAALGFFVAGPLLGIAIGVLTVFVIQVWLSMKADKRAAAFADQLGDSLQLMSGSLRAGYGLLQAIDAVASEAPSPTAEEFARIKVEGHLGRDLNEALRAMAARVDSEDFEWVAEAIDIHREIGGDLAEILDSVTETIRDRNRIRRRIKALSAEGRISAVILSILPFALAAIVWIINPLYLSELGDTLMGKTMVIGALVLMVIGIGWMRRIIRLVF